MISLAFFVFGVLLAFFFITTRPGNAFLYTKSVQRAILFLVALCAATLYAKDSGLLSGILGLYITLVFLSANSEQNKRIQTKSHS